MEEQNTISALEIERDEINDKYLRLYADFENFKKRHLKEKEELVDSTKVKVISSILDLNDDLHYAKIAIKDAEDESLKTGLTIIVEKFEKFLSSQGLEEIETDKYNSELHEVVSLMDCGEEKVIEVLSKGWKLNGKPIRYPKIILGR